MNKSNMSLHQQNVAEFMRLASQQLPEFPVLPTPGVRLLRARLIFEEAMETIEALGVDVYLSNANDGNYQVCKDNVYIEIGGAADLVKIVDGCADISVVNTGALLACGVADLPVLDAVDYNNLAKFGPGHTKREDGKLIKPPGHKPPDFERILCGQGWIKPSG